MSNQQPKTPILKAAQFWSGKGYPVFPLRPNLKIPATADGFKSATTDQAKVLEWFGGQSAYNLGLATGAGLVVADIDMKGGINGLETLIRLEKELGTLPDTLRITTPSGGVHLFFTYPENEDVRCSAGKLGGVDVPGIDIRANGGYVATAPSRLGNGVYAIEQQLPIAVLPDVWLQRLIRKPEPPEAATPKPSYSPRPAPDQSKQIDDLQKALSYIDSHVRDDWVKVGMALHNLGDTGFQLWEEWSKTASNYNANGNLKSWNSFNNSSVNVESVFHMAMERGWQNKCQQSTPPPEPASSHSPGMGSDQVNITVIIDQALDAAEQGDIEALQNETILEALAKVRAVNELAYQKYRSRVQGLKKKPFSLGFMDKETKPPKPPRYAEQGNEGEGGNGRPGKADLFIEMVKQWAQTFTDESGVPYVSFVVEPVDTGTGEVLPPHVETYPMNSDKFHSKAGREFYQRYGTVVGDSAMKEAISVLAAEADEGATEEVYLRCAMPPDANSVYIDLGDDSWQVIEVSTQGWQVVASGDCPVKFRRVRHARPLPVPEPGGNVELLWQHINVNSEDARLLVLAWLLSAMLTGVPYPVLEIIAGQGSAKSTTQERLKVLVDPNHSNLRKEPDSIRDLSISAGSNHVISLNNLSHLTTAQQDFMCSMSTGGGDAARKLYTTDDEAVWDIRRPVVMNGINQLVTRPDLADRVVCVELPKIQVYTDEHTLKEAWERDYPKLTGALYSLLAGVLRELPAVELAKPPRMADFAKLGTAMVRAMGKDVDFVAVFNRNRDTVVRRGVESSPVALALLSRLQAYPTFEGSMGELMELLDDFTPKHYDKSAWPKSPRGLGEVLRRLAPALEVCGVDIEALPRGNGRYTYRIRKVDKTTDTVETEL